MLACLLAAHIACRMAPAAAKLGPGEDVQACAPASCAEVGAPSTVMPITLCGPDCMADLPHGVGTRKQVATCLLNMPVTASDLPWTECLSTCVSRQVLQDTSSMPLEHCRVVHLPVQPVDIAKY